MRAIRFGMGDVEDLVYFFMNAHIDRGTSRQVMVDVLCRINDLPSGDAGVEADVEAWVTTTKEKLGAREKW